MGWSWAGASEWLSENKAEELEREKWEIARKDKLISLTLPELIKRKEAREAKVQASTSRISAAQAYEIDTEAAAILEAAGKLEPLLSRLDKMENTNPTSIRQLSERLIKDLGPERIAEAMNYALDKDFLDEPSSSKYIEILYDTDADDIISKAAELGAQGSSRVRPNIEIDPINTAAFRATSPTVRSQVQKAIEAQIGPQIGGTVTKNANGENIVTFTKPDAAARIVQNAVQYYFDQTTDVFSVRDPSEVFNEIYDKTLSFKEQSDGVLEVMADTPFDTAVVVMPSVTPPPSSASPEETPAPSTSIQAIGQQDDMFHEFNLKP